jgi:hypothetical protein
MDKIPKSNIYNATEGACKKQGCCIRSISMSACKTEFIEDFAEKKKEEKNSRLQ